MAESILIVRHGPGRGRHAGYWNEALEYLSRCHPRLSRRLRLHRTGEPGPELDDVAAAVFWLGDPLKELYPDCFEEAVEIAARVPRVANPPRALSNTIKSRQAGLWREAGLPAPQSRRFSTMEESRDILERVEYPVVLRPDRTHTSPDLHLCRTREQALSVPDDQLHCPGAVTGFVDTRDGYRSRLPHTLWASHYHKKRVFVIGDRVIPGHLYFSSDPFVRASGSTLARHAAVRDFVRGFVDDIPRWDRRLGLSRTLKRLVPLGPVARRSVRREVAFTTSAPGRPDLMRAAAGALDLDFLALDYSVLADGHAVLWEANPYPYLTRAERGILPVRRRGRYRNARIFEAVADWFRDLLRDPPAPARRRPVQRSDVEIDADGGAGRSASRRGPRSV